MPVVGTAGHVDHGKSTLVQALTGRDPDRWAEEKRRGLTIDLGFAWTTLPGGREVSFVDVPGHERFIKNMLAGTETIDIALFVVAADEGWMPQSEEHLAVLDLLGVRRGVVALTKADRVDAELLELAELEIEEKMAGTGLAGAPVVPVAAPEGRGVEEIAARLAEAVASTPDRKGTRPRLWIDRSFTISGAGTVVTGTLLDGALRVGDRVEVWPGPLSGRIRGLQSHELAHDEVQPGRRCAVNLAGLDRHSIERGAMLGAPGQWAPSALVMVTLRTARYVEEPLTGRGAHHLHIGSGAWPVTVRPIDGPEPSGEQTALVRLQEPLPLTIGDRFILREVGRRAVVGGGRILDPAPSGRLADARAAAPALRSVIDAPADRRAAALLDIRGRASVHELAAHSGGGTADHGVVAGGTAFSPAAATAARVEAAGLAGAYQDENPLRPGIPKASLASRLGLDLLELEALLSGSPDLVDDGATVRTPAFAAGLSAAQEEAWSGLETRLREAGLSVPRLKELDVDSELVHAMVRDGRLVRVSDDLAYLPEQIRSIEETMRAALPEEFTVAEFRDALAISRKYAVPLLEWLDGARLTVRRGDVRRVRRDPGAP